MKKKPHVTAVVSFALLAIGLASLLYYILLVAFMGLKIGFELFWAAMAVLCLTLYFLLKRIGRRSGAAQKRLAVVLGLLMAISVIFCGTGIGIIASKSHTVPESNAKYMLVLGARVRENGPSVLLNYRIDAACDYLEANPDTTAILCGGQGPDEPMTEAQAMFEALTKRGIDESRLLIENRSSNTAENIKNALEFMDAPSDSTVVTTTGYHLYRALIEAEKAGLTQVSGNPAGCAWITPLNYYVRELIALMRNWIFA